MAVTPPSHDDLAQIAERYGFRLNAQDVEEFRAVITGALASYDAVEQMYQAHQPKAPDRPYQWPADADNGLGAWYVTAEIEGADDGPLAGRRVAIKDNIAVAGLPMMNGSATVEGFVPLRDATVVTRVLEAGGTVAGKSVCEDLCFSGGSHTSKTGPVRNPWDRTKSAGGSSSGSAALVAAGLADLALGGDQGGSVRIPSAYCGTVGHKPTHGLVPYTGAFPIENTIDHLGPITRTVRDAALMLGVLAGRDGLDPRQRVEIPATDYLAGLDAGVAGLRLAVVQEGFGIPGLSQPGVDETVRAAVGTLRAAGADVTEISLPWHRDGMHVWSVIATDGATAQMIDGNAYGMNVPGLYDPELIVHYAEHRREQAAEMSESLKLTALLGRYSIDRYDGRHYAMARNLALELTAAYDAALADADVLVMPTLPIVATTIPAPDASREEKLARSLEMIPNTAPFDVSGHPATSVPAGLSDGLPVGLMIVGRHLDDATCLRVARAYENAVGGFPHPTGQLRLMAERLPRLLPAELDEAQRRLYDQLVSGSRQGGPVPLTGADGQLEGPFNAMLFAPGTGAPLLGLGTAVRFGSSLAPRAREIATLAVAAHCGSEYELYAHERLGRQAGLTAAECAALRGQQDPGLADPAEQAVLRMTRALLDGGDIPDDLYLTAERRLGRAGLVELVTLAGYYLTLAILMRTFRVDAPGDTGQSAR